ncbi:MAG: hypothetical protein COA58_14755 [Bacteroidetes bacterium]|nr:MAG: hypothetical protein COA58_14755 [Bacteroidota bacterium]
MAFGTIVFTLSDDEFTQFIAEVNLIRGIDTNCTIKDIWIDLPYEDVGLLLDTKELNKLKELLKASLYIENLNLLLQTLKISGPK